MVGKEPVEAVLQSKASMFSSNGMEVEKMLASEPRKNICLKVCQNSNIKFTFKSTNYLLLVQKQMPRHQNYPQDHGWHSAVLDACNIANDQDHAWAVQSLLLSFWVCEVYQQISCQTQRWRLPEMKNMYFPSVFLLTRSKPIFRLTKNHFALIGFWCKLEG